MDKKQYRIAKASGTLELVRNDMISTRIGEKIPFPMQMAIIMNAMHHLYAKMQELHGEDFRTEEFKEYEKFRDEIKAKVDAELEG